MPRVVDHDLRRTEIIEATWRTIARSGFEAATMAAIATEAGYVNGALKPYFATKHELFVAAFEHIFTQTNRRIATSTAGLHGLAAVTAWCREVMPLDDTTYDEARIIVPFWAQALADADLAARHAAATKQWRRALKDHVRDARAAGEIRTRRNDDEIVGLLLTALLGSQITATLAHASFAALEAQLDTLLAMLTR